MHKASRYATTVDEQLNAMALFAVVFPSYSFPITSEHFARVDQTHWVLDVCSLVRQQYWEVKEVRGWSTVGTPACLILHSCIQAINLVCIVPVPPPAHTTQLHQQKPALADPTGIADLVYPLGD